MRLPLASLAVAGLILAGGPVSASGQSAETPRTAESPPGRFGVGLQAGPLSGFTLKAYPVEARETRFEAASLTGQLNFEGFAHFQAMLLDELPIPQSALTAYVGPGIAMGVDDGAVSLGVAAVAGVRFFRNRFEIYMELTPRLILLEEMDAVPDAGVGFRIYL